MEILAHPDFTAKSNEEKPNMDNDIALLLLNESLKFDDEYVGKVELWPVHQQLPCENSF